MADSIRTAATKLNEYYEMPRKFFRRFSGSNLLKQPKWYLRPFGALLAHPTFMSVNRRSIAGAFWVGLFIGLLPMPGQTIFAVLAALMFRVNVPIAALAVWITNPVTMAPIFYEQYTLGRLILDLPPRSFAIELSWQWISTELVAIWKPLLLGCFISATIVASLGYLIVSVTWRLMVAARYRKRHTIRRKRSN